MATTRRRQRQTKAKALIDEIKDAIDQLHDIRHAQRRQDAAKDLIDYIELHHVDYPVEHIVRR